MTTELTVLGLGQRHYRVTGGRNPHRVTLEPVACDCADFIYRGAQRVPPMCKHIAAVMSHRAVEPLADVLDNMSAAETLNLVDPTRWKSPPPSPVVEIDPEDKAVALVALERWQQVVGKKPKPNGMYSLWRAAMEAKGGLEAEADGLTTYAAERYAIAHEWVKNIGSKGRVA